MVTILYASETGTAEDVAFTMYAQLRQWTKPCQIFSMHEYDISNLPAETFALFVVSTTGDGDPPETMKRFWSFLLRKQLDANSLVELKYSVFGLGDSSYEQFNSSGRKLFVRLKQLGAKEIVPLGLGDDQASYGYLTAFNVWFRNVRSYCTNYYAITDQMIVSSQREVEYDVEMVDDIMRTNDVSSTPTTSVIDTMVIENTRLTAETWEQDVRLIKLALPSRIIHSDVANNTTSSSTSTTKEWYYPGDIAAIHYQNAEQEVAKALSLVHEYKPSQQLKITRKATLPTRQSRLTQAYCTLIELFTKHLDINALPPRSFFYNLSFYSTNDEEREKLIELSSAEGTDLYFDYVLKEKRSCIEVLTEFKSVCGNLTLAVLLSLLPVIQPREYSIASSNKLFPNEVGLLLHVCF